MTLAPELDVSLWLNGPPQSLAALRGRVVLVKTFQMLCPGCISDGLPQAQRVQRTFDPGQVTVLGLHTVFEHHDVMGPEALKAFLHEYRIGFPVGVDRNDGRTVPVTMRTYALRGTPSTLLIDRQGRLRHSSFGALEDLALGYLLNGLLAAEPAQPTASVATAEADGTGQPALEFFDPGGGAGAVCGPGRPCS